MARLFISHSSKDHAFAVRLAEDLKSEGARVWLDEWELRVGDRLGSRIEEGVATHDYFLLLVSAASVASDWVQKELNWALQHEAVNQGVFVMPLRIDDTALPESLLNRKCADFGQDYGAGLALLLKTLRHARVKQLLALPRRRIVAGRRGIPTARGSRHQIGCFALGGERGCVFGVIEALGDLNLGPQLTSTILGILDMSVRRFLTGGPGLSPHDLPSFVQIACAAGLIFKSESGLPTSHPLGAKLALGLQIGDQVFVATLGDTSVIGRASQPDGNTIVKRFQSNNSIQMPLMDTRGIGLVAPIGFIEDAKDLKLNVESFPFATSGDLVALLSFPVTRTEADFERLAHAVASARTPEDVAVRLAESHEPAVVDTLCNLITLDPSQREIVAPGGDVVRVK